MKAAPWGAPAAVVTKTEFAALKGWRPSYVTKLLKARRLVLAADGKRVDVAASNQLLEKTRCVDKQGVREHHARKRGSNGIPQPSATIPSPESGTGEGPAGATATPPASGKGSADSDAYNQARAEREKALAAMAVMDQRKRQGELVEVGQVREMAARIAGIVTRGFERIGPRIGPVWSTEQEPAKRERLLEDELRSIQGEFADEVVKVLGGGGA